MSKSVLFVGSSALIALSLISGCSTVEPATSANDIFAPVPSQVYQQPIEPIVPAIPVAEPEVTTYVSPPPPVIQPTVVQPLPPIYQPAPQPLTPPAFDCGEIPSSKTGLVRYRQNCL